MQIVFKSHWLFSPACHRLVQLNVLPSLRLQVNSASKRDFSWPLSLQHFGVELAVLQSQRRLNMQQLAYKRVQHLETVSTVSPRQFAPQKIFRTAAALSLPLSLTLAPPALSLSLTLALSLSPLSVTLSQLSGESGKKRTPGCKSETNRVSRCFY